jgi:hypothetical protein
MPTAETEEHVTAQRAIADARTNLFAVVYDERWWPDAGDEVANIVARTTQHTPILDVLVRFCELLPRFAGLPLQHEPDTAEYHWSAIRCVLAGAGHPHHAALATILARLYPMCPLVGDESEQEWGAHLHRAHTTCGWPITFIHLPWRDLYYSQPKIDRDGYDGATWYRLTALLHVLKHVRYSAVDRRVIVHYNGASNYITHPGNSSRLVDVATEVAGLLGAGGRNNQREARPLFFALHDIIAKLSFPDLIAIKPLSSLPGDVLTGPWATTTASPALPGFTWTGRKLLGVHVARNGRVSPEEGDDSDVLAYDWNLGQWQIEPEREQEFNVTLPTTYAVGAYPMDVVRELFPNLVLTIPDVDAYLSFVDAILVAAVLRPEHPELRREFPLILCLPAEATLDGSTNQGKTLLAHTLGRAMCPSIPLTQAVNSSSAPDTRVLARVIELYGSLVLDEWFPSRYDNNLLSHRNMQSLETGGTASFGKVLDNNATGVRLRHSIVASSKAVDFPPDMLNRTVPLWLDALTPEQRARGDVALALESGKAAISIRLTAIDLARRLGPWAKDGGSETWRYRLHLELAKRIYALRTGREIDNETLVTVLAWCDQRLVAHKQEAEDSGTLAQLREGVSVSVPVTGVFFDLSDPEMQALRNDAESNGRKSEGVVWVTATHILQARAMRLGGGGSIAKLATTISGSHVRCADRTISRAFLSELRRLMPPGATYPIPGGQWSLVRADLALEETYKSTVFRLVREGEKS